MTVETSPKHFLLIGYSSWGHMRPLCSLAAFIAQEHRYRVTLITTRFLFDKVAGEVAAHFPGRECGEIEKLVTVIAASENDSEWALEEFWKDFHAALTEAFITQTIKCGRTDKVHSLPALDVVLGDPLDYTTLEISRKLVPKHVKFLAFIPGSACLTLHLYGPQKLDGFGDLQARAIEEIQRTGKTLFQACDDIVGHYDGSVVTLPGLPPFYDYEAHPQELPWPLYAILYMRSHRYMLECDGAIVMSSKAYEPQAIAALEDWFSETGRPVYSVGPLIPFANLKAGNNSLIDSASNGEKSKVISFLDNALNKYGERSLLYISFGTIYWPNKPEMIYSLIDEIIARGIPFVFTKAGTLSANMPDEVKDKIESSGLGLFSSWSPQREILNHPATGWFISHCGQNSVMEALAFGVPMICWPYDFDQPYNAMLVSLVHDIGYELMQVRSGEKGLKKAHRAASEDDNPKGEESAWRAEMRDVLTRARGADGERKRGNAQKMKLRVVESWKEGGSAREAFHDFLKLA
ncbi:hypothetical protein M0805_006322 [Coniferiporia weirii]|nr:hypothetical protein M0805_006322 [Coniferiporia weirii]